MMTLSIRRQDGLMRPGIFIGIVLLIKLCLMGLFSSDYQNNLFMRFVNGFIEQLFNGNLINPYHYFAQESNLFPYPPVMLLVESVGGVLSQIAGNNVFLASLLFKLPILVFDGLTLFFLCKLFPGRKRWNVGLFYTSPIILYACYMHGQLDIIPTALLLGALYYLTKRSAYRNYLFIICLSAAILCKLHILAILPILFLYIQKNEGWQKAIVLTGWTSIIVILCIAPFFCPAFISNVVFNHEQSILTKIVVDYTSVMIYLPVLALLIVYLMVMTTAKINRDLLFSYCGLLYSIFLCLIPPMPGWYVWVVPFIAIFFVNMKTNRYFDLAVYVFLNVAYLLYFIFAHKTNLVDLYFLEEPLDWLKQESPLFRNGIFTILIATLVWTVYSMYRSGVASNLLYRKRNLPFTIGIAGDSGSGKSSFLKVIKAVVGRKKVLTIEGDGDHRWERGNAMWKHFTHLNPKSNFLYRQALDIEVLRSGQSVERKDYDHDTGKFTKATRISPKPYLVLCGLHSLYLPQVRNMLDLKIYMDVDEKLRRYWKIKRDMANRGYSREKIMEQIVSRETDADHYIHPQKRYADLVVSYYDAKLKDCWDDNHEENLSLKITVDAGVNLEPMIQEIETQGITVRYDYDESLERQTIYFERDRMEESPFPISEIAERIIPQVDDIAVLPLASTDCLHGILELTLLLMVSYKMSGGG